MTERFTQSCEGKKQCQQKVFITEEQQSNRRQHFKVNQVVLAVTITSIPHVVKPMTTKPINIKSIN